MIRAVRQKNRVFQVGSMNVPCENSGLRASWSATESWAKSTCGCHRRGSGRALRFARRGGGTRPELGPLAWPGPQTAHNSVLSPRGVHNDYPNWRHYREYGGGAVTDFGAHHFDIAQWGLGMDSSGPLKSPRRGLADRPIRGATPLRERCVKGVHARVPGHNDITFYGKERRGSSLPRPDHGDDRRRTSERGRCRCATN